MTIARKIVAGISALLALVLVLGLTFLHAATGARESLRQSEQARDLNEIMSDRIIDHLSWVDGLSSGLLVRGESFKGNLDPTTCALGTLRVLSSRFTVVHGGSVTAQSEP